MDMSMRSSRTTKMLRPRLRINCWIPIKTQNGCVDDVIDEDILLLHIGCHDSYVGVVRALRIDVSSIDILKHTVSRLRHRPTRYSNINTQTPTPKHRYTPRVAAVTMKMKRRLLTGFPVSSLGRVQVLRNML